MNHHTQPARFIISCYALNIYRSFKTQKAAKAYYDILAAKHPSANIERLYLRDARRGFYLW